MAWPLHFVVEHTNDLAYTQESRDADWYKVIVPDVHPDVNDPLGRVVTCYMTASHDIHVTGYTRVDLDSGEFCGEATVHPDTPTFRSFRTVALWAYRYGVEHPEIAGLRHK
jgi:hypothetical protein